MKDTKTEDILRVDGIFSMGFGLNPKILQKDKRLSIEAKAIYCYIASYAGNGFTAFPSRDTILSDLGVSESRYYRHFQSLKKFGYITVSQERRNRKYGRNIYTLVTNPKMLSCPQNECPQNECPQNECSQNECTQNECSQNEGTNINKININNIKHYHTETTTTPPMEIVGNNQKMERVVVVPVQIDNISESAKKEPDVANTSDPIYNLILDNLNISLTQKQVAMFDKLCNGNIDKFVEKVNMLKKQSEIREPMGWLIRALQEDYKESIPYINNDDTKKKKSTNKFINYEQRKWDYETIERLAMEMT